MMELVRPPTTTPQRCTGIERVRKPLSLGRVRGCPPLPVPGLQDQADLFEQSFFAGWFVQNVHRSQFGRLGPGFLVRSSSDEDDRNVTASRCQMTLQLKPTHSSLLGINNETGSGGHLIGPNKLLR